MKMAFTIYLLLQHLLLSSQTFSAGHNPGNKRNKSIQPLDPAALSRELTASHHTDLQKVEAIFRWITDNIAYRTSTPMQRQRKSKMITPDLPAEADSGELKPLTERMAEKVLQDRKAVCEGYARLFQSLCGHAGITAAIITGYARSGPGPGNGRFRSNHSWNAVYIDSTWRLLDVTWASGYIAMPSGQFVRHYDDYYFLTPPEKFSRHHYPDDIRWTLLQDPPLLQEFRHTPFRQRSFVKYGITSFFPATGIIVAAVGDTIQLELETTKMIPDIVPDSLWDPDSLQTHLYAYVHPQEMGGGSKVQYRFAVLSENIQWLHVMYNNDAVLRYRLKIRKGEGNRQ